jgi:hypothetical protein
MPLLNPPNILTPDKSHYKKQTFQIILPTFSYLNTSDCHYLLDHPQRYLSITRVSSCIFASSEFFPTRARAVCARSNFPSRCSSCAPRGQTPGTAPTLMAGHSDLWPKGSDAAMCWPTSEETGPPQTPSGPPAKGGLKLSRGRATSVTTPHTRRDPMLPRVL